MKRNTLKKGFVYLVFLLIIIVLVTACSGGESAESSSPDEVAIVEAATVPAPDTAVPEPTSLPPTVESEPEATNTTVPTPTTMPTLTPEQPQKRPLAPHKLLVIIPTSPCGKELHGSMKVIVGNSFGQ